MTSKTDHLGRDAETPVQLPLGAWWRVLRRTYAEAKADNLGLISAGASFYAFLALVPTLAALVLVYGLAVSPRTLAEHMTVITEFVPSDSADLIRDQLRAAIAAGDGRTGLGFVLALGLALFGATKGTGAIMTATNIVYEQVETRGLVRLHLTRLALTLAMVALAVGAIGLAVGTAAATETIGAGRPVLSALITAMFWLVTAGVVVVGIGCLYRFAPDRADARWQWLTPGTLLASGGVLVATLGFSLYSAHVGKFSATYGALGAVVALLTWLYFAAYVVLLGAELNAELEHQTARDTTTGAERPLGQRRAVMADTVAD